MSSRIRFAAARNVFEAFADLSYAVAPPADELGAPRLCARPARLAAPDRFDRLHRPSAAAPGGGVVGDPVRSRHAWDKRRRRGPSRRRGMGARARGRQSQRRAGDRQRRRSARADDLARLRRRLVGRQHDARGSKADAGAAFGLRQGGAHGGHHRLQRRRSARRRAENRGLRGSRDSLRRWRRGERDGARKRRRRSRA